MWNYIWWRIQCAVYTEFSSSSHQASMFYQRQTLQVRTQTTGGLLKPASVLLKLEMLSIQLYRAYANARRKNLRVRLSKSASQSKCRCGHLFSNATSDWNSTYDLVNQFCCKKAYLQPGEKISRSPAHWYSPFASHERIQQTWRNGTD